MKGINMRIFMIILGLLICTPAFADWETGYDNKDFVAFTGNNKGGGLQVRCEEGKKFVVKVMSNTSFEYAEDAFVAANKYHFSLVIGTHKKAVSINSDDESVGFPLDHRLRHNIYYNIVENRTKIATFINHIMETREQIQAVVTYSENQKGLKKDYSHDFFSSKGSRAAISQVIKKCF